MPIDYLSSLNEVINLYTSSIPHSLIISLILICGACIGSFLNVVIYRTPLIALIQEQNYLSEAHNIHLKPIDFRNTARSHCAHCGKTVPAYLNIPIISWLLLRGRTKCCRRNLSIQYPLIEIITMVLWGGLLWLFGFSLSITYLCLAICLCAAVVICTIDIKHKLIFDLHSTVYVLAMLLSLYLLKTDELTFVINGVMCLCTLYVLIKTYETARNTIFGTNISMMGNGDWALWLVLFWVISHSATSCLELITQCSQSVILIALLGIITLTTQKLFSKADKKESSLNTHFPAAPAIIIATFINLFYSITVPQHSL